MNQPFLNICFTVLVILPRFCFTQELSYIHYDTKDGLAGSTVYDICQDKDGFIWFATETGLSRFDGKTFKNYTVSDGLPDNEILRVFADSRGRIGTNTGIKANQFLTDFASLVRQTLENSDKRNILLSDEIDYLNKYLQMEKMRFANNFNYTITIGNNIDINSIEIPSLLLQPFVENCLRHGIRYKEHGTGIVNISFLLNEKTLVCSVRDNGVGRRKASEYKSKQHIEYQSRGMKLTEKRIELTNRMNRQPITIEILDLKNEEGNDAGTEVKVNIPINIS